jgi:hypothetical protein
VFSRPLNSGFFKLTTFMKRDLKRSNAADLPVKPPGVQRKPDFMSSSEFEEKGGKFDCPAGM